MQTATTTDMSPTGRTNRKRALQAGLASGVGYALARMTDPASASKRTKRIKTKRCRPQVEQCVASLTEICAGEPTCLGLLTCCDLFADCNAAAGVACIFTNAN